MALSRGSRKLIAALQLVGVIVVTGVIAAGFLVPYVGGAGLLTRRGADRFLNTRCDLTEKPLEQSTAIYARDAKTLIANVYLDNRHIISLKNIPVRVRDALIDTEDRRFYSHHGIDTRGLARALVNGSGGQTQGGSTLTQQYVKQVRFYQATTDAERNAATAVNANRKIYEASCALDLEKKYTKDQILEKYLNIAYFGEQSYGIDVAARTYFNTTPAKLSVPQAAVIVGLVKDPSTFDPFHDPKAAKQRRDAVIQNMVKAGHLTAAAAAAAQKTPLGVPAKPPVQAQGCSFARDDLISNVGFFCDYALDWLTHASGLSKEYIATGGLKIVTSIDPTVQNTAQKNLFQKYPADFPSTIIQPAIDPTTGEIKAMATTKHYDYAGAHSGKRAYTSVQLFKNAYAGSGSTYKYFALIAALTAGIKPEQSLTTAGAVPQKYFPRSCPQTDRNKPETGIANAGAYSATYNLADATIQSSNTYFVGLEDQIFDCDLSTVVKTAQSLGMNALNLADRTEEGKQRHWSVAERVIQNHAYTFTLGQESTSGLELAEAYGVAANDGIYCQPKPVLSVTTSAGKSVKYNQPTCAPKMSQWVARTAIKILTGDTLNGTAASQFNDSFYSRTSQSDHLVAGKTGTNNASTNGKDNGQNSALWFVGLTPRLVAVSAVVNADLPTSTVRIPGVSSTDSTSEFYGAYAAKYWIGSFGTGLTKTSWQWPTPEEIPGATQTPFVIGNPPEEAAQKIRDAGFKPAEYPIQCGGSQIPGVVGYAGPAYAVPNSTVYYCVSNGKSLISPPPPSRSSPTKKPPTGGGHGGGGGGHGGGGNGHRRGGH
ncbi:MAG: transglycosylase domain-containing protein [Actinomycetota bacterium]|nr:transglycosylase domain-containing protein [Actinomycetota bacterium]